MGSQRHLILDESLLDPKFVLFNLIVYSKFNYFLKYLFGATSSVNNFTEQSY